MMRGQSQNVCIKLEKIFVSIENIAEIMGGSHRDHQQYYGHCGQPLQGVPKKCDLHLNAFSKRSYTDKVW